MAVDLALCPGCRRGFPNTGEMQRHYDRKHPSRAIDGE